MFKRVLVANRGEIAVRIIRTCRDMGIWTIALYDASDRGSLHVRLADECVELLSPQGYMDGEEIIQVALDTGAEAIHPGYGFLAEQPNFVKACEQADVVFIGPPSNVLGRLRHKIEMLQEARSAGFPTPEYSAILFGGEDLDLLRAEADQLGYPLVIKSCIGGRGRASRLVRSPERLEVVAMQAQQEAKIVFGDERILLEKAILPVNYIEVQVIGDHYGNLLHLGERDGSLQRNHQKLVAESPSPSLTPAQREQVHALGLAIARFFDYRNAGTVEFLLDGDGLFYFTEIKARIQVEHPVTEMTTQVDIVREQLEIASGKRLSLRQADIPCHGWAIACRINAEDPWNHFLPSPGHLSRFRLPGGPNVRVDTYAYSGCDVPVVYDPMLAKLIVWGETREECVSRMRRTLQDFAISGIRTNLPLHQRVFDHPHFASGQYDTGFLVPSLLEAGEPSPDLRDLAVAAAIAYLARQQGLQPTMPDRLQQGWHRANRRLS